ncbi:MAG TPA: LysM peptidoglycan-binding domain-containing protein [Kiritimatiellia bacterium]|nr:LysM peptidoglycan-binding domain-containing protein [Kiritimatiellia bacterium]
MNRQVMRVVAGVNLIVGCFLMQGCGMFNRKSDTTSTTLPDGELPPVEVQPLDTTPPPVQPVETSLVELPSVQTSTPYTIQKGDTLSAIAYKYNVRWQDIVAINPGIVPNRLRIGQVIQLPGQVDLSRARSVPVATPGVRAPKTVAPKAAAAVPGPTITYVVKPGDSLSVIAHKHGIKTAALREANGLKSDKIIVGQKLKVPGAVKTPSAAPVTKKSAASVQAPKTVAPKPSAAVKTEPAPAVTTTPPPAAEKTTVPAAVESAPVKIETAPPPAAPAAESSTQTYTVKEGEDLYAVAIRWGVSPSDLKALNNLTSSELKAGTVLKIPNAGQ